jgi:hypothetical protein
MSVEEDARYARANAAGAENMAQLMGARILETLAAIRDDISNLPKDLALREAVKVLGVDMHVASTRPCSTCQALSAALGEPFGCNRYAAKVTK